VSVELDTERLRLRQFRESDFATLAEAHADADFTRYFGGPSSLQDSWRWLLSMLGHWSLRGFGYFALEEKATRTLCGAAGVIRNFDWPETEMGWRVYPPYQKRGFATEAAARIRAYAYKDLGLTTLVSYVDPDNIASKRVAEHLGARPDATMIRLRGEDALVYRHPYPLATGAPR
jgi:RimJ/RimL family protein N-acetyltransferase